MAAKPVDLADFNKMIQEGRKKRKNEALAKSIFNKKPSTSVATSFASRIGVHKVTTTSKAKMLRKQAVPYARPATNTHHNRGSGAALSSIAPQSNQETGISVRGMASRFAVTGSNFMPGTTAADIQAVLTPSEQNNLVSCNLVQTHPVVVAEMIFNNRDVASGVVTRFDGMMADGHKLRFYLKEPAVPTGPAADKPRTAPQQTKDLFENRRPAEARLSSNRNTRKNENESMEIDSGDQQQSASFNPPTQPAAMDVPRGPRSQFEDGRYGFRNSQPLTQQQRTRGSRGGYRGGTQSNRKGQGRLR